MASALGYKHQRDGGISSGRSAYASATADVAGAGPESLSSYEDQGRSCGPSAQTCFGLSTRTGRPTPSDLLSAAGRELGPVRSWSAAAYAPRTERLAAIKEPTPCQARRGRAGRRIYVEPGAAGRSRPPERSAQPARRRGREPGRRPARRRAGTTADGGATATPPVRAPARGANRRRSSSWSRWRTPFGSARSPGSRCPPGLATAASAAAAIPPPRAP